MISRTASAPMVVIAGFLLLTPPAARPQASATFEPHRAEGILGMPVEGELARISVPHDHFDPTDPRRIELAVARFSTDHPDPGTPIFFLAGGPGASGVDGAAITASHPQIRLSQHAEVIGIDQRGTGRSRPRLTESPDPAIAPTAPASDVPLDRDLYLNLLRTTLRTFEHQVAEQGFDLGVFDTAQSVEDLEAVRRLLGLERIVLYGSSYGSHLGLAYLRRYPERVERAVFQHVEGPDHTWKLPGATQTVLRRVSELESIQRRQPGLDLLSRLRRLLERIEVEPLLVDEGGHAWAIGPFEVRAEIAARLSSVTSTQTIPALLGALENGDASDVVSMAAELRRPALHPLLVAMDCASGGSAARRARITRERDDPGNLLRDAPLLPILPEACDVLDGIDLDFAFRAPFETSVPTLFVSGDLDARTPPSNVEALLPGFGNGVHLLVENASHDSRQLMAHEFRGVLQAFLRGEGVPSAVLRLPPPLFYSSAVGSDR